MNFKTIRTALSRLLAAFAVTGFLVAAWTRSSIASLTGPDPAHGLVYPCHRKVIDWYYGAHDVVRSWDMLAFALILLLAAILVADGPWTQPSRTKLAAFRIDAITAIFATLGVILALAFTFGGFEDRLVDHILARDTSHWGMVCMPLGI